MASVRVALEQLVGRQLSESEWAEVQAFVPSRDDVAIASILSRGRVRLNGVSKADFQVWCAKNGQRAVIERHALNLDSPLCSVALTIRDFLLGSLSVIEFGNPANSAMLAAWVAGGAMPQGLADELIAAGTIPDPISFNQVSDALNIAEGRMVL